MEKNKPQTKTYRAPKVHAVGPALKLVQAKPGRSYDGGSRYNLR